MATTTNYGWTTPNDTDLVKDGAAAIRTLGSSVDTTTKALNPETTLGDIAYRSATANTNTRLAIGTTGQVLTVAGGVPTWATSDDANAIQNAIVDAKGDIIAASDADTPARLAVGANGTVLTADSAEATGLKWATPASGGLTTITSGTLSGTSLNLTSISGSFKHLQLEMYGVVWGTGTDGANMIINGLTSSNYTYGKNAFRNTTAGNYGTNAVANWDLNDAIGNLKNTGGRNHFSFTFFDYASSAYAPLMKGSYTFQSTNDEYSVVDIVGTYAGLSAPITAIKFATNNSYTFSGGTYILYGVN